MNQEALEKLSKIKAVYAASKAEDALALGEKEFGVPGKDLEVTPLEEGRYQVRIVKREGKFEILITPGGEKAILEYLYPPIGKGHPVSVENVLVRLKAQQVIHGIDSDAIEKAVSLVQPDGPPITSVVIARYTPPVDGHGGKLEFRDPEVASFLERNKKQRHFVKKGERFARLIPSKLPQSGESVQGHEIPGKEGINLNPSIGDSISLAEDRQLQSQISGYLVLNRSSKDDLNGRLEIEPPVQFSPDAMAAFLTLYPPVLSKLLPTPDWILNLLQEQGVTQGIRKADLPKICQYILKRKEPVNKLLIAKGRSAVKGEDGHVKYSVPTRPRPGTIGEDGRIDFRERGFLTPIHAGELLAEKFPPGAGRPGMNVRGEEIPAEAGQEAKLDAGQKVEVSADGRLFKAAVDGVLLVSPDQKISMTSLFEHRGDVDFSVGNLNITGSANISGSVKPDFCVHAEGDIHIDGMVEASRVDSGSSIAISRGITGKEKAILQAGFHLTGYFAEAATLISGGDIEIIDTLLHCKVFCGGDLRVTQRSGRIIGGTCVVGHLVQANEIGAPAGARTRIMMGLTRQQFLEMENLKGQIASIQKEMEQPGTDERIRKRYQGLISDLVDQLDQLRKTIPTSFPGSRIEIHRQVYPRTEISFGLHTAKVTEVMKQVVFVFDQETQAILHRPLDLKKKSN